MKFANLIQRAGTRYRKMYRKIKAFGTFDVYGSLLNFVGIDLAEQQGLLCATPVICFVPYVKWQNQNV